MPGTPTLDQNAFRARNDNGSETTATWKAANNTNWSQAVDTNFRVRFLIQEKAGNNPVNMTCQLQYNLAGAGWNNVTGSSSVVRASSSTQFTDGTLTTEQMGGAQSFSDGEMDEVDGLCNAPEADMGANQETEFEFSLQIRSVDVTNGQTLQLRCTYNVGTATYTNTPTITVVEGTSYTDEMGAAFEGLGMLRQPMTPRTIVVPY